MGNKATISKYLTETDDKGYITFTNLHKFTVHTSDKETAKPEFQVQVPRILGI